MIDHSQGVYYLTYTVLGFALAIAYIKLKSTEGVVITTKEFKNFQTSFVVSYSVVMLCELIATSSFYHTFSYFHLSLEKITKLYIITLVSTIICSVLIEIIDIGSRKNKSLICLSLFTIAMLSILISHGHYEFLLLSRIVFGAGNEILIFASSFINSGLFIC